MDRHIYIPPTLSLYPPSVLMHSPHSSPSFLWSLTNTMFCKVTQWNYVASFRKMVALAVSLGWGLCWRGEGICKQRTLCYMSRQCGLCCILSFIKQWLEFPAIVTAEPKAWDVATPWQHGKRNQRGIMSKSGHACATVWIWFWHPVFWKLWWIIIFTWGIFLFFAFLETTEKNWERKSKSTKEWAKTVHRVRIWTPTNTHESQFMVSLPGRLSVSWISLRFTWFHLCVSALMAPMTPPPWGRQGGTIPSPLPVSGGT